MTNDTPSYSRDVTRSTPAQESKPRAPKTTREEFSEDLIPAQFKLPRDLVTSLKLHSFNSGKTMSEIVLESLTSPAMIKKAWVSTRRAA